MKFAMFVRTYEEGGRVIIDDLCDAHIMLDRLCRFGLSDKIGELWESMWFENQMEWDFMHEPWTVFIERLEEEEDDDDV